KTRVPTCATRSKNDPIDPTQLLRCQIQPTEFRGRILIVQSAAHRVFDRVGLLVNLLQHVMRKAAQLDVVFLNRQFMNQMINSTVLAVRNLQRVSRDECNLMVSQIDNLVGSSGQRRSIAGNKMLAVTDSDNQRTSLAGGND